MSDDFDVVIIGAGLAGLTAALFASKYGLRTVIVDTMSPGGQIMNAEHIDNFPGFPNGVAGYELGPLVWEQASAAGAEFMMDQVVAIEPGTEMHQVLANSGALRTRAVIIASGSKLRSLGIPGEEELLGLGVSHCASCDGPLFRNETVCVVGGGDSALGEALTLSQHAAHVLVFHRGERFRGQQALVEQLLAQENIEVRPNTEVQAILGSEKVTGVRIKDTTTGQSSDEPLSGVFTYIGLEPNSQIVRGVLTLDPSGHIPTNIWMETEIAGIYAAGDIRQHSASQLITAAGDGATAAIAAHRYVKAGR